MDYDRGLIDAAKGNNLSLCLWMCSLSWCKYQIRRCDKLKLLMVMRLNDLIKTTHLVILIVSNILMYNYSHIKMYLVECVRVMKYNRIIYTRGKLNGT